MFKRETTELTFLPNVQKRKKKEWFVLCNPQNMLNAYYIFYNGMKNKQDKRELVGTVLLVLN